MSKLKDDELSVKLDIRAQEAQETIHQLIKSTDELRKQNQAYRKEKASLERVEGDHTAEYKRFNDAIAANTRQIEANKRAMEKAREKIDLSRMSAAQLGKRLKELKRELNNTSKATDYKQYRNLENQIRRTEKALAQAQRSTRGFLTSLLSLDKMSTAVKGFFMGLGMVITTYVLGAFKNLVSTIQDFERANSKLASVLGTTLSGVSRLTEQAKFLGRTTTATASQVTGLQTELAKLGFSQEVIEKLTPATLKFARAVDTDLSSAAAFAGADMRMFDKDAGEAEAVMASFAVATTKSALDFSKLQASLATVGPVAHSFGFSLEETTALLGQLSNAGFDASSAATATRNILLNLADANGDLAKALGGPVTNLDQLVAGLKKLQGEGIDLAKALELTDKRSVAAFSTFLGVADNILVLRDSITGCTADFNKMAATMGDNAAGSWAGFESAVEGLILKFFDFREVLRALYEGATEVVNWIGSIIEALSPLGTVMGTLLGIIGSVIGVLASLVGWLSKLVTQTKYGRLVLNALIAGLVTLKVATLLAAGATKTLYINLVETTKSVLASVKAFGLKIKTMVADTAATIKAAWATRSFNAVLKANPLILFASLLAMVITGIVSYVSETEEATEATDAWSEASRNASKQYGEQKGKIKALLMVARNENLSLERRKKAVAELNSIIPGYNAKIDETTKRYTASKEALDLYLQSLEKEMRYKANTEKLQELVSAAEQARDAYDEAEIAAQKAGRTYRNFLGFTYKTDEQKEADRRKKASQQADADLKAFEERLNKAIEKGIVVPPAASGEETVEKVLDKTNEKASETVSRLKEISTELKRLRKIDPESDEELDRIQKRIQLLQEERRELMGKGRKKHQPGTYGEDSLDEISAPIDDAHQREVLKINKSDEPEIKKTIAKNRELIRYCAELSAALDKLREKTDSTHAKTLDAINAEQNKLAQQAVTAQQAIDKAMVKQDADTHKKRLDATEKFYESQSSLVRAQVMVDGDLEEAAKVYQLDLDRQLHDSQLKELQRYYDSVAAADYYGSEEKHNLLDKISADISKAQNQILTDTGKFSELVREAMTDSTSADGIKAGFDHQRAAMLAYYAGLEERAGENSEAVVALEKEKQRRIAALNFQYQEQMWQIQELTGLTWANEYDRELAQLENYHRQSLIKEKDYQRRRLQLGMENSKKYFDYYAGLGTSMFSGLQEAEIAASDAKYEVLIRQAQNNGEETAALEEEKENRKLEIQKKYADVNFAIKISQIVADTAVSIMKAFADLGPIGGAIAAAMLTATGVAQVISAKAERDKIRNLRPSHTPGSSSTATPAKAERVLSGYAEGGYTGDGDRYEVAGVVHRGEYVVPKPIMDNPRVVDAVGTIEAVRLSRRRSSGIPDFPASVKGYADGGYVDAPGEREELRLLTRATDDLREATKAFKRMTVRAYVVYKDIKDMGETLEMAAAPFTRNMK